MEAPKNELQPSFEPAAAPPPKRVTVTLDLDADLLAWLKEQPADWRQEINNTMRFFMETSLIRSLPLKRRQACTNWKPQGRTRPATPTESTTILFHPDNRALCRWRKSGLKQSVS